MWETYGKIHFHITFSMAKLFGVMEQVDVHECTSSFWSAHRMQPEYERRTKSWCTWVNYHFLVNIYNTILYIVRKCGSHSKITISVQTSYRKVVGSRVKAKMAIEFIPYSVCECGRQPEIAISARTSYVKVVSSRVKAEMAIKFFPYMPIQSMWVWGKA